MNTREYRQFTSHERINLTIAALARGDFQEADHLWDTCPSHNYKAIDFNYSMRINAFTILSMAFREKCLIHYHNIKHLESSILLLECLPSEKDITVHIARLERMDKLLDKKIAKLKAVYQGLEYFCIDAGLNYEGILQTVYIDELCSGIHSYLSHAIEAHIEDVEHYKKSFAGYWQG